MTRWGVLAVAIISSVGCGKSKSKPTEEGSPGGNEPSAQAKAIPRCDPARPPDPIAMGSLIEKDKNTLWTNEDLERDEVFPGVHRLGAHPCCDIPYLTLGYAWRCKFYEGKAPLAHDLLIDRGWEKADPAKRVAIATELDAFFADGLSSQPKDWSPYKTFSPPKAEALPDGGVKLARWVSVEEGGGHDAPDEYYALQEQTITPAAQLVRPVKQIERYEVSRIGYPDPKVLAACDPKVPPTREWALAVYQERMIGSYLFEWKPDPLKLEPFIEDVWVLREPGSDGKTMRIAFYYRKCKHSYDPQAFTKDILADQGWDKADAKKRIELATMIDGLVSHRLDAQPAKWDAKHVFKPPTAAALPDGGVTLTRWMIQGPEEGYSVYRYRFQELTFDAKGKLATSKDLDEYELSLWDK